MHPSISVPPWDHTQGEPSKGHVLVTVRQEDRIVNTGGFVKDFWGNWAPESAVCQIRRNPCKCGDSQHVRRER